MSEYVEYWDWSNGEAVWLPKSGAHLVKVVKTKIVYANSGNQGIELIFADRMGRKVKDVLWNTEKAVNRNWFVCTCLGMTSQEISKITPEIFIGRYCQITTKADGDYTAIDSFSVWSPESPLEEFDPVITEKSPSKDHERSWNNNEADVDVPF